MVLKSKVNDLIINTQNIYWFSKIGSEIDIGSDIFKIAKSKDEAIKFWLSEEFEEARSVAWEAFRQQLIKRENLASFWNDSFHKCKAVLIDTLEKSDFAKRLIKKIGQSTEEFASQLPFLGAIGEILISDSNLDYNFFSTQIKYFSQGHWVCGWEGSLHNDRFVYPSKTFYLI